MVIGAGTHIMRAFQKTSRQSLTHLMSLMSGVTVLCATVFGECSDTLVARTLWTHWTPDANCYGCYHLAYVVVHGLVGAAGLRLKVL